MNELDADRFPIRGFRDPFGAEAAAGNRCAEAEGGRDGTRLFEAQSHVLYRPTAARWVVAASLAGEAAIRRQPELDGASVGIGGDDGVADRFGHRGRGGRRTGQSRGGEDQKFQWTSHIDLPRGGFRTPNARAP